MSPSIEKIFNELCGSYIDGIKYDPSVIVRTTVGLQLYLVDGHFLWTGPGILRPHNFAPSRGRVIPHA